MTSKKFAMRLKQLRAQRKMSQADLAGKVGVSREYIARLETGHHDPPLSTVEQLAKALKVKMGEVTGMTPEERETIVAYVSEVETFARLYARQFEGLKTLLVEKGLMTPKQLDEAMKTFEAEGAVEEALDPRFQALERLRRWLEEQK